MTEMKSIFGDLKAAKAKLEQDRAGLFARLVKGSNWFYVIRNPNLGISTDRARHGKYVCPKKTEGKPCYGCQAIAEAKRKGDKATEDKWKLKTVGYFWVVARDATKGRTELSLEDDVKILQVPTGTYNSIIEDMMNDQFDPSLPSAMRPLCITKRDTPQGTRYAISFGEERDLSNLFTMDFLNQLTDLNEHPELRASDNAAIRQAIVNNEDPFAKKPREDNGGSYTGGGNRGGFDDTPASSDTDTDVPF